MEQASTRMTQGSVRKTIVRFALPVFWGNLFQQLYNVVDSLVVGNYLGSDALAAVGSSGSLIFLLVGLFSGIFVGAGVVIARYYGARDSERVARAIHATVAFALTAGAVLTAAGIFLTPQILRLMDTPNSVLPNSILYFRIYFAGIMSVVLYNTASGIFQAVGDSRHPLYYLIISSALNVALDLLFVAVFRWGIGGAALATVISQSVSAFLGFFRLCRIKTEYRIVPGKIRFHSDMLKQVLQMGIPSGLQNSVIALANLVVQSSINTFGAKAVAGCGAYAKIEGFGFLPITSFALALTTFIGQNLGAGERERAKKGARFGILTCIVLAELVGVTIFLLAPYLVSAFNDDPEVIAFGALQAHTVTLFYFLLAFSHCIAGILRGAGKSIVPMIVMLVCWCVIRIAYITLIARSTGQIQFIFWAYPFTWSLSSVCFLIYYQKSDWLHTFDRTQAAGTPGS
ncbi:MAG: MATE family efflux transporter [Acutalibacteraceae bacterium]|jgi:putative MATE family efflux protein